LTVIGPWTLTVGEDGAATYVDGWRPANVDEPTRKVEVVPADQLTGAVERVAKLEAALVAQEREMNQLRELAGVRKRYHDATGGSRPMLSADALHRAADRVGTEGGTPDMDALAEAVAEFLHSSDLTDELGVVFRANGPSVGYGVLLGYLAAHEELEERRR
jgi:hypothetical protein